METNPQRSAPPESSSGPSGLRNPWWIPPLLGRVPAGVERRHLSLLSAVAFALLFEDYDLAMMTSVLPEIRLAFAVAEQDLPFYLGLVRLGSLPALVLIPFADRIGRRRTFLASLLVSSLATVATGFAWNIESFVIFQMVVRIAFVAGVASAYVLISEEFPADRRGWGMGVLAALGATGYGLAALLFSQIEHLPYGWRFLYWVGAIPLACFPIFRRTIPETDRFARHNAGREASLRWREVLEPLRLLVAGSPWRFVGISVCIAALGFAGAAAFQFTSYYTRTVLGWSPGQYATMVIVGGAMGIVGNVVAGSLGDRIGRRWVGAAAMAGFPLFVAFFYWGPAWAVWPAWIGFVFTSSGGRMILRAFSTELFATDRRGTATGWTVLLEAFSQAGGLMLLFLVSDREGDLARFTPLLALATVVAAVVLLRFPETRSRELDGI